MNLLTQTFFFFFCLNSGKLAVKCMLRINVCLLIPSGFNEGSLRFVCCCDSILAVGEADGRGDWMLECILCSLSQV